VCTGCWWGCHREKGHWGDPDVDGDNINRLPECVPGCITEIYKIRKMYSITELMYLLCRFIGGFKSLFILYYVLFYIHYLLKMNFAADLFHCIKPHILFRQGN
jgi:hypothetical protein